MQDGAMADGVCEIITLSDAMVTEKQASWSLKTDREEEKTEREYRT